MSKKEISIWGFQQYDNTHINDMFFCKTKKEVVGYAKYYGKIKWKNSGIGTVISEKEKDDYGDEVEVGYIAQIVVC